MEVRPHRPDERGSETEPTTCAALLRSIDWSRSSLGPFASWPQSLKSFVAMVIEMPTPAIIFWGPDQIQLYNDAYGIIMGPRHPRYFGAPYRECWPDTYPVIHPWMQKVLQGEVIQVENQLFVLTRYGFTEEAYFTFTFSPLRDDTGAIAGILQPVVEVTQEVIGERRAETLRSLASHDLIEALGANPKDIPFALFYGRDLQLLAHCGIASESIPRVPPAAVLEACATRTALTCEAREMLGGREHVGTWDEPTRDAFVLPVTRSDSDAPRGVLVFGVSPRLAFDDKYRELFEAIGRELAAGLDAEAAAHAERELFDRAEVARAEAEVERRRLHSIFMQAPVAITILGGPTHVIELANPLVCRIWGHELDELLDKPLLSALPELAGQGLDVLLDGVRVTGKPCVATERLVRLRRAEDGELEDRYFNFVYNPLADASGRVAAVIVVAADVTIHVRARQAAEQLASALDLARRDAELARDAAQQANRSKDEFLAMLGHELRNPLAPIFTALELLRMRGTGAASGRECEIIERQARHLAGLVDDLLDVSRITTGKIELKRHVIDLADIMGKAVETASPLFEKHRHELHLEVPAQLVVKGDPARLTQVFANLLTNAAKYTDPGGRIFVEARADAGDVVVEVRDTGRGISQEMLPRLFDLFVQEPQNLDRAQGGLGLGLAIVKSLVVMHGGTVEARSDGRGRGSSFVVRLPAAEPAAVTSHEPPALIGADVAQVADDEVQAILIVDDNEDAASLLADTLTARGHACTVAYDGPRALELARHTCFDTVLLDIGLPAMDGYEVARHLRELPGWRDVTLVAITGYGQRNDKQRSLEAGFDHHLVKPVDVRALTSLLVGAE